MMAFVSPRPLTDDELRWLDVGGGLACGGRRVGERRHSTIDRESTRQKALGGLK